MFRKSSNNPFIQGNYLNAAYNDNLGGPETVGQRYPGLLGQTVVVGNSDALKLSDSSIGTLYEGVYQLIKFTTAITRGQLVFWGTLANNGINDFEVGSTVTATTMFRAGVALRTDASASGKYGWIQVAGLASMLYGTVTDATIGNGVYQTSATAATVDALADAGADATALSRKRFVGIAYATPASDTVARVLMNLGGFYPVIGN